VIRESGLTIIELELELELELSLVDCRCGTLRYDSIENVRGRFNFLYALFLYIGCVNT